MYLLHVICHPVFCLPVSSVCTSESFSFDAQRLLYLTEKSGETTPRSGTFALLLSLEL